MIKYQQAEDILINAGFRQKSGDYYSKTYDKAITFLSSHYKDWVEATIALDYDKDEDEISADYTVDILDGSNLDTFDIDNLKEMLEVAQDECDGLCDVISNL